MVEIQRETLQFKPEPSPRVVQRNAVGAVLGQARYAIRVFSEHEHGKDKQMRLLEERVRGLVDLQSIEPVLSRCYGEPFLGIVQRCVRARCQGEIAVGANARSPVRRALLHWTRGIEVPDHLVEAASLKIQSRLNYR